MILPIGFATLVWENMLRAIISIDRQKKNEARLLSDGQDPG